VDLIAAPLTHGVALSLTSAGFQPGLSYPASSGLTKIAAYPDEPSKSFPFFGSSFYAEQPMVLSEKCIPTRNPRPPLIQGFIGRIDGEDEGKFAATHPAAPSVALGGGTGRKRPCESNRMT
jgi:hypothetical protein